MVKLPAAWHYRAQQHRAYWRARAFGARARFRLKAALFRVAGWIRGTRESAAILYGLGRLVALNGVTAAGLVILLAWVERLLLMEETAVPQDVSNWLRAIASNASFETVDSILLALLQVAGVFIGLYFTAVSVVASTVYSRVQADIRDLLTRERVGNAYLKIILLVASMSLLILAVSAAGYRPGVMASGFTVLIGILAVLSFVPLGNRVFRFFDPTSLVELYILPEIADRIRRASPKGFAWKDPSFQNHYQKEAESRLETYTNIVRLAIAREHLREGSLVRLANRSFQLLQTYTIVKAAIPKDSLWFKQAIRHKDWFRIGVTEADIAIRASISLMHETVPDPMWFEDYIFAINRLALKSFFESRDYKSVVALSENMRMAHVAQARSFDTSGAIHLYAQYQAMLLEHLVAAAQEPEPEGSAEKQRFMLACADYYGLLLATITVEFANALREAEDFELDAIRRSEREVRRRRALRGAPADVIDEFERISARLSLERAVEGSRVSPAWYVAQLLALRLVTSIKAATEGIVERCANAYLDQREIITNALSPVVAAQIVQRGFEVQKKAEVLLEVTDQRLTRLTQYRRVSDFAWPLVDVDELQGRMAVLKDGLVDMLCNIAPKLVDLPRTGEIPDYFGEMYWRLAEECAEALYDARTERFRRLLPVYFVMAHSALQKLQLGEGMSAEYVATYLSDIIIDLLEISGLALLYSELRGGEEWAYCVALWDRRLADESAEQFLAGVVASANYRSSQFTLSPRDTARGRWEQALTHVLQNEGLVQDRYGPNRMRPAPHPSPILRAFARNASGFVRPYHVFLAAYVRVRREAANLDFGMYVESFAKSLERELHAEPTDDAAPGRRPDPPLF